MRKAAGPDGISSRVHRDCTDQLCEVVRHIFNLILNLERMPTLWKTSLLVPVPKWLHPRELKPLPTCGLDLPSDEDIREDGPETFQPLWQPRQWTPCSLPTGLRSV